jgi:hypothetical protein
MSEKPFFRLKTATPVQQSSDAIQNRMTDPPFTSAWQLQDAALTASLPEGIDDELYLHLRRREWFCDPESTTFQFPETLDLIFVDVTSPDMCSRCLWTTLSSWLASSRISCATADKYLVGGPIQGIQLTRIDQGLLDVNQSRLIEGSSGIVQCDNQSRHSSNYCEIMWIIRSGAASSLRHAIWLPVFLIPRWLFPAWHSQCRVIHAFNYSRSFSTVEENGWDKWKEPWPRR